MCVYVSACVYVPTYVCIHMCTVSLVFRYTFIEGKCPREKGLHATLGALRVRLSSLSLFLPSPATRASALTRACLTCVPTPGRRAEPQPVFLKCHLGQEPPGCSTDEPWPSFPPQAPVTPSLATAVSCWVCSAVTSPSPPWPHTGPCQPFPKVWDVTSALSWSYRNPFCTSSCVSLIFFLDRSPPVGGKGD